MTNIKQLPIEEVESRVFNSQPTLHTEFSTLLSKLDDLSNNQRKLLVSYLRIQASRIKPKE
jgi:hypothetical protein